MNGVVREHTSTVTAVLSVVSLALVFAAAGRAVPAGVLPAAPQPLLDAIPHVNAVLSLMAIVTIVVGLRAVRYGNLVRHRQLMVAAFGLFACFLVLYLYRVALLGPHPFTGPDWVALYVYYPILGLHMVLAVVCIPLLYHTLLLASSYPMHELTDTAHPRLGRITAPLWALTFALGFVVYLLLYLAPDLLW